MSVLESRRDHVLEILEQGDLKEAERLIWRGECSARWFELMAPVMESAGARYERSDRVRALWSYEQAKALYETFSTGATSGGEGQAEMAQGHGAHLGKKIWLLKS